MSRALTSPPSLPSADRAELERLEESLWRASTRFDREYMDRVLAEDFAEFGRSGRVYDRAQILAMSGGHIAARLPLRELAIRPLAADVVLVTYVSEVGEPATEPATELANRASVWTRGPSGWQLRFHQGTPLPE